MEIRRCDILVVGAGPAGSSAARAAAESGLDVLVVERRDTIGVPVQCAEYVPAPLLGEAGLDRRVIVQSVRGMRTILPGGEMREIRAPGLMIRRDLFDQALAGAAQEAGAEVLCSTRAVRLEAGGLVATEKRNGPETMISARVVIGADGPRSAVGRSIGSENCNLIRAVQWRVPLVAPMEYTEVYFDEDFYGGYGWLFPVGGEANVGLARRGRTSDGEPIGRVLERFLSRLAEEGKVRSEPIRRTGGWIPAEPVRKVTRGNVLLVGDAAGHTHPITGSGVSQALMGGQMAGKWAARAVETGDLSVLGSYEEEWRELFGDVQQRAYGRRAFLEANWDHLETAVKTSWVGFREYYIDRSGVD